MTKFQFYIYNDGIDKKTFATIRRIRSCEDDTWFSFPEEFRLPLHHEELVKLPAIKAAIASFTKRGQHRAPYATLDESTTALYADSDGNFIYKGHYLLQTEFAPDPPPQQFSDPKLAELVSHMSKISEPKDEPIKDILKHFLIEKFHPKNRNVEAWCLMFEKESSRFSLCGSRQIEVFKSFLDPSLGNWFAINQRRFLDASVWSSWKEKLVSTFGDNSFNAIRYALNYKFMNGSLIDYAIDKEKMLLELDRGYSDLTILDLIIAGLPSHVYNSLNKTTVTNIDKLHSKLKKFESTDKNLESSKKFKNFKQNSSNLSNVKPNQSKDESQSRKSYVFTNKNAGSKVNFEKFTDKKVGSPERKFCSICAKRGNPGRLHKESACWFKDEVPIRSVNNVEIESSESISSDDDLKN